MKTIGIHKSTHNPTCDFIVEIVNVDKKQYEQVMSEELKNRELEFQKEEELRKQIKDLIDKVNELSHEIAILKGEE